MLSAQNTQYWAGQASVNLIEKWEMWFWCNSINSNLSDRAKSYFPCASGNSSQLKRLSMVKLPSICFYGVAVRCGPRNEFCVWMHISYSLHHPFAVQVICVAKKTNKCGFLSYKNLFVNFIKLLFSAPSFILLSPSFFSTLYLIEPKD